jgi:hypothetical protein
VLRGSAGVRPITFPTVSNSDVWKSLEAGILEGLQCQSTNTYSSSESFMCHTHIASNIPLH